MNKEIVELLEKINYKYLDIAHQWCENDNYSKLNLDKRIVKDICVDKNIFMTILSYREFLMKNTIEFINDIQLINNCEYRISARIKNRNSTEYKLKNYLTNKAEEGKVPLKKCFNDLLGVRIICKSEVTFREIKEFVNQKYPKFWCTDSSKKEGYIATHVYLSENNYTFPWELQIWSEKCEKSNLNSHAKYKQGYTVWENNNKGGVLK